ncbi:MAG TPA: AAA family ATPase, partial [Acidimicrobiales bacterium]
MGPLDCPDGGTMVGRQPELARLRALWQDAVDGAFRFVLLAGEPGVGKTRLASELAEYVEADGGQVLVGRCSATGPTPYEPFVEALEAALPSCSDEWLRDQLTRNGPALVQLVLDAAKRLGGQPTDTDTGGPRPRFHDAIAAGFRALGPDPVLLVLEDLHRATPSTVQVLERLAHGPRSGNLLVVATYRDAAIHPSHPLAGFLDNPASEPLERLFLANLSPQAVTALLVDRAAVAGRSAGVLAEVLWRASEGNPLLLTEVIRDLHAAGGLSGGTVNVAAVDSVGVAHTVAEVVNRRLGGPGSQTRGVVEVAAAIGPTFPAEILLEMLEGKDDVSRTALASATTVGVVAPVAGRKGWYRFVHDVMHEAVHESLAANRRVYLHQEIAELLERPRWAVATAPAVRLHHRAAATPVGRSAEAVEHAREAAAAATRVHAFAEAAEYLGRAIAFLDGAADPSTRIDLLMQLGEAHRLAGESARARQSYLQAAALAEIAKDGPRLGRAVLGLGDVFGIWGADGLLIGLLDAAVAANPDDPGLRAKLVARLAQARAAFDSPDERKARSDRAWELAWDSRDPATMGAVLRARHEALSSPDDLEDRVEIDGELFAMASSASDPDLALLAHGWRLVDLLEQGHVVDADRDRALHAKLAIRSHDPLHQRDAAAWSALWALLEGRSGDAAADIDRALALGQDAQDPAAASNYWVQQLGLLLDWGSDAELESLVDVWRELARAHDGHPWWRATLALLLASCGRAEDAAVELDDLLAEEGTDLPQDRTWLPTVAAMGEAAALVGDERVDMLARLLAPYSRRMIVWGPGLVCRGSVSRVLGMLWACAEQWTAAERHFQAALAAHERVNAGPLTARTRSEFGRALAYKPGGNLHTGRVRTTLLEAVEEADTQGMMRLFEQTQAALHADTASVRPVRRN